MSRRRALVVHTRMPAFDRDSGSQDIDNTVQFLLRAGWQVTFLAREEEGVAEERHANRLRQMGVATHAGFGAAERLLRSNDFDLALIAFWELAAELLPLIRERLARRPASSSTRSTCISCATRAASFGQRRAARCRVRRRGDARAQHVQRGRRGDRGLRQGTRSARRLPRRRPRVHRSRWPSRSSGRRTRWSSGRACTSSATSATCPNREAVEYLCAEVLPLLDPDLLERHPLTVIGNWLDQVDARHRSGRARASGSSAGSRRCSPTSSGRGSRSCRCCTARA